MPRPWRRRWSVEQKRETAYVYTEDRRGEQPTVHLAAFRGMLQVDGYAGFGKLAEARKDNPLRLAFCWAHARRPFYEFYWTGPLKPDRSAAVN